jgi:hypothetical protein
MLPELEALIGTYLPRLQIYPQVLRGNSLVMILQTLDLPALGMRVPRWANSPEFIFPSVLQAIHCKIGDSAGSVP